MTRLKSLSPSLLVAIAAMFFTAPVQAVVVLGTGTAALLDNDLTDPDNNGAPDANVGYDAIFASDNEPAFGGGEFSFNVFDNLVGGGNAKWCCDDPSPGSAVNGPGHQLDATILPTGGNPVASLGYELTHFTMTSSNDSPDRDPLNWQILGSIDGVNFSTIFDSMGTNYWASGVRNQVLRFDQGIDYALQNAGYTTFRYSVTQSVGGNAHALGEIEYFGAVQLIPEPATMTLLALGGLALLRRRRVA